MEKGGVKSVVLVCLVLSLLAGRSTASFLKCYAKCFFICEITPGISTKECAAKCLQDCLLVSASSPLDFSVRNNHYFCKLGCATSLCTNFSTRKDPAEKKVGSCVDSCSQTCIKT